MAGMISIEVTLAGVGGAAVGWFAHTILDRRRRDALGPIASGNGGAPAAPTGPTLVGPGIVGVRVDELPAVPLSEGANSAGRVILHLASLGRLGCDEVAPIGFTQRGISTTLGIRQGTLAKTLARLEAADVVEVDKRHVSGESRRLKIYRLTALGESVSRDLRHRRANVGHPPNLSKGPS